jgi:hypothetical protein
LFCVLTREREGNEEEKKEWLTKVSVNTLTIVLHISDSLYEETSGVVQLQAEQLGKMAKVNSVER